MFDLEYKNKEQLNEIKKQIESKTNTKIRDIRYNVGLYNTDEDFITAKTVNGVGFFMAPFKNKDLLDKEIKSVCKKIIVQQNSLK